MAQVNWKWTGSVPEVNQKWNARDLQAQGTCTLRFLSFNSQTILAFTKKGSVMELKYLILLDLLFYFLDTFGTLTNSVYVIKQNFNAFTLEQVLIRWNTIIDNSFTLLNSQSKHFRLLSYSWVWLKYT